MKSVLALLGGTSVAEFKIEGLDEVLATMLALPDSITKNVAPFAMRKGANVVAKEARSRAPVRTGNLRDRIAVRKRKRKPRDVAVAYSVCILGGASAKYANTRSNRRKGLVGQSYQKQDTAYYWRFLEFGTEKLAARPFLRPAFEFSGQAALNAITEGFRTGLARAVTKAMKK